MFLNLHAIYATNAVENALTYGTCARTEERFIIGGVFFWERGEGKEKVKKVFPKSIGNRSVRRKFIPKDRKFLCVCVLSVMNQQHTCYLRVLLT